MRKINNRMIFVLFVQFLGLIMFLSSCNSSGVKEIKDGEPENIVEYFNEKKSEILDNLNNVQDFEQIENKISSLDNVIVSNKGRIEDKDYIYYTSKIDEFFGWLYFREDNIYSQLFKFNEQINKSNKTNQIYGIFLQHNNNLINDNYFNNNEYLNDYIIDKQIGQIDKEWQGIELNEHIYNKKEFVYSLQIILTIQQDTIKFDTVKNNLNENTKEILNKFF